MPQSKSLSILSGMSDWSFLNRREIALDFSCDLFTELFRQGFGEFSRVNLRKCRKSTSKNPSCALCSFLDSMCSRCSEMPYRRELRYRVCSCPKKVRDPLDAVKPDAALDIDCGECYPCARYPFCLVCGRGWRSARKDGSRMRVEAVEMDFGDIMLPDE